MRSRSPPRGKLRPGYSTESVKMTDIQAFLWSMLIKVDTRSSLERGFLHRTGQVECCRW